LLAYIRQCVAFLFGLAASLALCNCANAQADGQIPVPMVEAESSPSSDQIIADLQMELASVSERLNQIEGDLGEAVQRESIFLESTSSKSLRQTTGRLHLDYWAFPQDSPGINQIESGNPATGPKDRFELRRVRIGVRGSVSPKNVNYQLDLEFAGVDQIGIRDAWIGIEDVPLFSTVRVGNQKRPYSLSQLNSSNFTIFIERPFIADSFNDPNRRLGIQSYGVSEDKRWNWRYGLFNLVPIDEQGFISSNYYQVEMASRLAWTAWYDKACCGRNYWHLGLSNSFGFPSSNPAVSQAQYQSRPESRTQQRWINTGVIADANATQLLGSETVLNLGSFQFGAEYLNLWLQRETHDDLHFHGGYVYLSYFLTGEHIPWNRDLGILGRVQPLNDFRFDHANHGWGAFQFAVRGSLADLNDADINGGLGRSVTFGLNWYLNSHTRLQSNYLVGHIDDRRVSATNVVSGYYQVAGMRLMIDY